MITVVIYINERPVFTRSARNMKDVAADGSTRYDVDDGSRIWHKREDGAVALAKEMLETIKEEPFR
jgi:hypothetical protein